MNTQRIAHEIYKTLIKVADEETAVDLTEEIIDIIEEMEEMGE